MQKSIGDYTRSWRDFRDLRPYRLCVKKIEIELSKREIHKSLKCQTLERQILSDGLEIERAAISIFSKGYKALIFFVTFLYQDKKRKTNPRKVLE